MKFLPLIWAALWRRKPRTILTMLSVAVAFLLFGLLQAFSTALKAGVEVAGADRLVTVGRYHFTEILPYSYLQQIKSIDGVRGVTHATWFDGIYISERNFFPRMPVDPQSYLELYPEIQLPPTEKQAWLNTRTGAIAARSLADRYGWKVGDKIPLQATIWPSKTGNAWSLDLVGIFDNPDAAVRSQIEMMLFQHDFFDEARAFGQGTVGWYIVRTTDPARNLEVAKAIDARFANSPNPTRTDTEKAFNQSFVKQLGDIGLIVRSILGAVFFTLLMLTGNTMMQSVRERVPELAVLKTVGFTDRGVLFLVLAESATLCVLAALVGLVLAQAILPGIAANIPGFQGMQLRADAFTLGVVLAALLAALVGALPARRAQRLQIVDALAGR
jgi:putative ABC transport system permease protein